MITSFDQQKSIISGIIGELRNVEVQGDSLRFRRNLERFGELCAYEISKTLDYKKSDVTSPLGTASVDIHSDEIVLCAVLRAAIPMHQGFLNIFDRAENAFAAVYRMDNKSGGFEIHLDYFTSPSLDNKVLIIIDPMLATGSTIEQVLESVKKYGTPKKIHVASAIASVIGINKIKRLYNHVDVWVGAIDEELTAKAYIVPGLGDAGDLAYGSKS